MKKLQAGSLLLAIFLSFIIAVLLGLILVRLSYFSVIAAKVHDRETCEDYFFSAVAYTLTQKDNSNHAYNGDLLRDQSGIANINFSNWGLFPVATVTVVTGKDTLSRSFMIGKPPDSILNACIYLEEHNKPLLISGNTLLNGDVYLPKSGINPTYLDGTGYNREKLFNGRKHTSSFLLKDMINSDILLEIRALAENNKSSVPVTGSSSRKFSDSLLNLSVTTGISPGNTYTGHIVIRSDSALLVPVNCTLDNVILIAPYIKFEDGFKGKIQAIATDSIITGENCSFPYPSAFVLLKGIQLINNAARICLGKGSVLEGCIFGYCTNPRDEIKIYTELCPGSRIKGVVFSDGFLEINGNVTGTVLTGTTILKNGASVYDNQLHNVTIDRLSLSGHYLAPLIMFKNHSENKILQWLD